MTKPVRFEDLPVAELRRSAVEDFAVEIGMKDNAKLIMAALTEAGVSWGDYVSQHPEVKPEPVTPPQPSPSVIAPEAQPLAEREHEFDRRGVVTDPSATSPETLSVEGAITEAAFTPAPVIHTATPPVYAPQDKVLLKMERENPLFETRGHRFTKASPYALVSPKDANYILRHETGFRQAYPDELEDFYS